MKAKDKALLRKPWHELSKRVTEYGVEKLCHNCGEWWPLDEDFFSFIQSRRHFHSYCKACCAELQAARRMRRRNPAISTTTGETPRKETM